MNKHLFSPGHTACAGCGQSLAARLVLDAAGKNTIVANNTGCLEVFSSRYPESCWEVPFVHSLFENAAAVGSGIEAALKYLGKKDTINVIVQAGDGGTADIGIQALSGMWERGADILSICYDNEAYENCLSIFSLILTKDGLKKIIDVKVGDEIYAFDQKNYQLVTKKCSGIFNNGNKEVFELKTSHQSIEATGNHPFLVLKKNSAEKKGELIWKKLEEIKIGEQLVVLKNLGRGKSFKFRKFKKAKKDGCKIGELNEVQLPEFSSLDLMRLLGIYVGAGIIRKDKKEIGFCLPEGSEKREIAVKSLNKNFKIKKFRDEKKYIYINSVRLINFIDSLGFGQKEDDKTIPGWLFTIPLKEKESFVNGLMLEAGCKISKGQCYGSLNFDFLKRLRILLQTMGYRVKEIEGKAIKKAQSCLDKKLPKARGFSYICFSRPKNTKGYSAQYQNFLSGNKFFEIESVTGIKSRGTKPTLDLRVEDEHNFIADGMVVHNTGIQRSGLTPYAAATTTSPAGIYSVGNPVNKKPMPEIAMAHGIPYVATASIGFPQDLQRKVKKAFSIKGPKYIQVHVPCPLGWQYPPQLTLEVAKLAIETGLFPLIEYENSKLIAVREIKALPVEEYLKAQGRFKHLLNNIEEIKKIQAIAEANIAKYKLRLESPAENQAGR